MGENTKALQLMRGSTESSLLLVRQALIELADELDARVDQQSDELTARTHRTILITWIVIVLGLAASFAIALSIVQVEVVKVVLSFRSRILEVAEGRLDQPIANLNRPNEIGDMSRALQTLQLSARERETQSWVKSGSGGHHGALAIGGGLSRIRQQSCCHGSSNPWICCTARSTSLTKRTCALVASAPLRRTSPQNRGNLRSASLWWDKPLLSGARFRLLRVRTIPCKSRLGWQW